MKKLKLEIDELRVESFTTAGRRARPGTVHGHDTQGAATCACDPGATVGTLLSCVGCTTYDYTQGGGDSCDYCMGILSASPQYCPCC